MAGERKPEPRLRGTLSDVPAVLRAVLHVFELVQEDLGKWCGGVLVPAAGVPDATLSGILQILNEYVS